MKKYVRYMILLILIIAFGLLCISIFNKITEPDIAKVNNKKNVEDTVKTKDKDKDKDIVGPEIKDEQPAPPTPEIPSYPVPDTATGDSNETEIPREKVPLYSEYKGNIIIIEEE